MAKTEKGQRASLIQACMRRDLEKIQELLKSGADVNEQDQYGDSPLSVASFHYHVRQAEIIVYEDMEIVKKLLEAGANVNNKDNHNVTALHLASIRGHIEVVELLVKSGAEINVQNKDGNTALHLASMHGFADVSEFLIKCGADDGIKNNYGNTASDLASECNHNNKIGALGKREYGRILRFAEWRNAAALVIFLLATAVISKRMDTRFKEQKKLVTILKDGQVTIV